MRQEATLTLEELRRRIDELDEQIVVALAGRLELARATRLQKTNVTVHDPEREAAVLAHVEGVAARCGVDPAVILPVYALILELCRELQATESSTRS